MLGRRWSVALKGALVIVVALTMAAGCGSEASRGLARVTTTTEQSSPSTTAAASTSTTPPPVTTTTDPGLLPQTTAEPTDASALDRSMQILWNAIVADDADLGLGVFFPRTAYIRMKTGVIPDPAGDYINRLIAFYRLDIVAYHDLLGDGASSARLVSVAADTGLAAWIPPGYCENLIGYWHLPGVRLVYEESGTVRSFAVASLISWHSVWYVVHLGPNPRPSDVGTVDSPANGPGTPGPPGGC
jgi:hypothetical protein